LVAGLFESEGFVVISGRGFFRRSQRTPLCGELRWRNPYLSAEEFKTSSQQSEVFCRIQFLNSKDDWR